MSREVGTPPSSPVSWEVFAVSNREVTARVEARSWYDARALGEQLLGRPRGDVDARRIADEAAGPDATMDLGGCCEPPLPTQGPAEHHAPRRRRRTVR